MYCIADVADDLKLSISSGFEQLPVRIQKQDSAWVKCRIFIHPVDFLIWEFRTKWKEWMNECEWGGYLIDPCTVTISWCFLHSHSLQSARSPIPPMTYSILHSRTSWLSSQLLWVGWYCQLLKVVCQNYWLPAERNKLSNGSSVLESSFIGGHNQGLPIGP
jgi:hypothetical protein